MVEVGVHDPMTTLSELLRLIAAGEEVVILRSLEPVAQLVPVAAPTRMPGEDTGRGSVPADVDAPLSGRGERYRAAA